MRNYLPFLIFGFWLFPAGLLSLVIAQADITYIDELQRMVDLDRLWLPPEPGERCIQFSSFDRASRVGIGLQESQPSWSEGWYANHDRDQYLREETRNGKKEYVQADIEGPGSIVRIWSANPSGTLYFYLDGASEPAWSADFKALTSGEITPFTEPLAGVRGKGYNFHAPIPFAKHIKVTCSDKDHHYEINIRLYPKTAATRSFHPEWLDQYGSEIAEIRHTLESPQLPDTVTQLEATGRLTMTGDFRNPNAWTDEGIQIEGPAVVRELAVKIGADPSGKMDYPNLLRRVLISVELDNRRTVRVPVGDFFGSTPQFKPYRTYPLEVTEDGWGICRFPMPIPGSGKIALVADGPLPPVDYQIRVFVEYQKLPARALAFRASWHLRKQIRTRPLSDFRVLNARGPGRYVGCCLSIANPSKIWWGEGDEKFFVDGESFPSTFGTGTEDYFGYAFADTNTFWSAYHAQPQCDGPDNSGYTCLNRFQLHDSVPFQKSFLFDLEIWHWRDVFVDYATTAYWYGPPQASSGLPFVPAYTYRTVDAVVPEEFFVAENAFEGEFLEQVSVTAGEVERPYEGWYSDRKWSHERQLIWRGAKPGDRLALEVPVPESGNYRVEAVFTKARDYGIVQIRLNDRLLGDPIDLFEPHVIMPTPVIELGALELKAGVAQLVLEIVDRHPKAEAGYLVGLDYIRLTRID